MEFLIQENKDDIDYGSFTGEGKLVFYLLKVCTNSANESQSSATSVN